MFEQLELIDPQHCSSPATCKGLQNSEPSPATSFLTLRIPSISGLPEHPPENQPWGHMGSASLPTGSSALPISRPRVPMWLWWQEANRKGTWKGLQRKDRRTLLPSAFGTREWGEPPGNPCVPQRSCTESRWAPRSSDSRCWCAPLHAPHTWAGQPSFPVWEEVAEKFLSSHWGRAKMGHQHCKPQLAPG